METFSSLLQDIETRYFVNVDFDEVSGEVNYRISIDSGEKEAEITAYIDNSTFFVDLGSIYSRTNQQHVNGRVAIKRLSDLEYIMSFFMLESKDPADFEVVKQKMDIEDISSFEGFIYEVEQEEEEEEEPDPRDEEPLDPYELYGVNPACFISL